MATAIRLENAHKRFGDVEAINGVTAAIEAGQLTGLVGPDGAGKTTLVRMMAALMAPTEGRIEVAGHDVVTERAAIHEVTGYMPQRFGLYEELSVIENLELHARLRAHGGKVPTEQFDRLLQFAGLERFKSRLAGRLSGGMKQKLGLACALMTRPPILLLDEPSVGVDPVSRKELFAMVEELTGEGIAVVWATGYLDEAERCTSVLLLEHGKLAYAGPPKDLTARVAGRSFLVTHTGGERRRVLVEALDLEGVRDGVLQGDAIRVVVADEPVRAALDALAARHGGGVEPAEPRFEDAFIDLLGGGPGGRSAIAEKMDDVTLALDTPVRCSHLTKRFGDFTATDDVCFEVKKGEVFGLLGPNGAGKSTTFKMLCGLLRPTSGEVSVAGRDIRHDTSMAKLALGYMAQKFSLYGLLTVRQNLEFFSGMYGLEGRTQRDRIDEMVNTFELTPHLRDSPDTLPLGFKQRLALACALMHRPPVLFLDEPTSGVDPITRREFWTHINGLVRKGVTVLVTTHFMDEAEYCDRVALMYQSKTIALGTPDELKSRVAGKGEPVPTMEQAFIRLIEAESTNGRRAA